MASQKVKNQQKVICDVYKLKRENRETATGGRQKRWNWEWGNLIDKIVAKGQHWLPAGQCKTMTVVADYSTKKLIIQKRDTPSAKYGSDRQQQ